MSAEETKISASPSRLDKIDKLKGTSNYQIWRQQFEDELKLIWRYIGKDFMAPVITSGGTVTTEKIEAWEQAHDKICIMLKSRCERNARSMIKDKTNAKDAWTTLEKFKP